MKNTSELGNFAFFWASISSDACHFLHEKHGAGTSYFGTGMVYLPICGCNLVVDVRM